MITVYIKLGQTESSKTGVTDRRNSMSSKKLITKEQYLEAQDQWLDEAME